MVFQYCRIRHNCVGHSQLPDNTALEAARKALHVDKPEVFVSKDFHLIDKLSPLLLTIFM